jgi:hypothetical protein
VTRLADWGDYGPRSTNCGHCAGFTTSWAVRDDGGSWTVWPKHIIPTGARIDAWLCGVCLKAVIMSSVQPILGMRLMSTFQTATGKRSAMRRLLAKLRGERA